MEEFVLKISKTERRDFSQWLVEKGYCLTTVKEALRGTGRKAEPTSPELEGLWKEFEKECF